MGPDNQKLIRCAVCWASGLLVGNPPWVNWESLPKEYREATKPLWARYGLFTLKGQAARLGGGKKDLSMLFVYVCLDSYLAESGQFGFVITQTLFKTREAADGFRRFSFQRNGQTVYVIPSGVIDMTELHPFEGATNRTASFLCHLSTKRTSWPVKYEIWRPRPNVKITEDSDFEMVDKSITKMQIDAIPMVAGVENSAWLTAPTNAIPGLKKVRGTTPIKAHAGVCTWAQFQTYLPLATASPALEPIDKLNECSSIALKRQRVYLYSFTRNHFRAGCQLVKWCPGHRRNNRSAVIIWNINKASTRRTFGIGENYPVLLTYFVQRILDSFTRRCKRLTGCSLIQSDPIAHKAMKGWHI
jgi:hypothetical protein